MSSAEERVHDPDPEIRYRAVLELEGRGHLHVLLERLSDDNWRVRKAAVQRLSGEGSPEAIEALLGKLDSADDAGGRNSAAEALAKIGEPAVPQLAVLLASKDPDLRKFSADILGEIGSDKAVPALVKALGDDDRNVHAAAAEALGKIGGAEAAGALESALSSNDRQLQLAALDALGRSGAAPPFTLIRPLARDRYLRRPVIRLLGRLSDRGALELLVEALRDASRGTREAAFASLYQHCAPEGERGAAALGRMLSADPHHAAIAAHARDALLGEDLATSSGAALVLGLLGEPQDVAALAKAAADERMRDVCAAALLRLGTVAGPVLVKAVPSLPPGSRVLALSLLGTLREKSAVPMLLEYAERGADDERAVSLDALGALGDPSAIPRLTALLSDARAATDAGRALAALGRVHKAAVREACLPLLVAPAAPAVVRILEVVGTPDDLPKLRSALGDPRAAVRVAALEAAHAVLQDAAEEPLRLALADEAPEVRAVAARALAGFSSDEALDALFTALTDREPDVAAAAADALGTRGDARAVAALEKKVLAGTEAPGSPAVLPALSAVRALSRLGAATKVVLQRAAGHSDPEVVKEAVLAATASADAEPVLLEAARHPRWDVRRAAAEALGMRGDRQLLSEVGRLLETERDPLVRGSLERAVKQLEARPARRSP